MANMGVWETWACMLAPLLQKYEGGGTSSYHPKMLLKVLVYAYVTNIYSSRKIEAALKENINFMWLAAISKPDHNTINRFRGKRLKDVLGKIFVQVVELLAQEGLLIATAKRIRMLPLCV